MKPLFGDIWCAEAFAVCDGRRFGAADLRVQYEDLEGGCHHQVFENGCLTSSAPGLLDAPDLWLRLPAEAQWALVTRSGVGDDVLMVAEAVDPASGGVAPPAPRDEVEVGWFKVLPEIPGVPDLRVGQVLTGSPFGDVAIGVQLSRGRVVDTWVGPTDEADVTVVRDFGLALRERMGSLDLLESLEGGRVDGDLHLVTLFLGIYETEECVEARRALTTPSCGSLVTLAEILSSPEWAAVAAELRGESSADQFVESESDDWLFDPAEDVVVSLP